MVYYGTAVEEGPETKKKRGERNFGEFIKKNEKKINKLKEKYPDATKAGIQDLLFLIWLQEEDEKTIFEKANELLGKLFKGGWIKKLRAFKLVPERLFKRK